MSQEHAYSYHLFFADREFRSRFLPAVRGSEDLVRELLDAADASGPSWTALHKLFDDTRVAWEQAARELDGEATQRSLIAAFGQFVAHLRPAFVSRAAGFSHIDPAAFPELAPYLKSPAVLLRDEEGRALEGVPSGLPDQVPARCLEGRSGGVVILQDDVRPCVDAFREVLPRLAQWLTERGHDAAETLTVLLAALVEAKIKEASLLEASDVLEGDAHLPKEHALSWAKPETLPPAVVREVAKLLGHEAPLPEPKPQSAPAEPEPEVVAYTPQGNYEVGQRLQHKAFGTGEVTRILDSRRLQARFEGEEKVLVQGLVPRQRAAAAESNGAESSEE